MIYVFYGTESLLIKRKVDDLTKKLNILNVINYDFDNSNIIDIINESNYIDLFNEKKLIIVSNFSFKKIKENEEKTFSKYLDNMNENVIILKCNDETLDNRKFLIKKLIEKCNVCEVKKLDYKGLHEYVTDIFKKNNKKITYDQVKRILSKSSYNNDFTIKEVEKLLLYKIDEDVITDDDIENVISKNFEKELFTLTDNVMSKNISGIWDSYKILVESGLEPIVIIDSLSKQFRILYQVKLLIDNTSEKEIASKIGVNPFVIKKVIANINNYKEDEIIKNIYELSNLDIDIKVNGLDKYKVLENYFLKL